jgi:hypothetical protein
MVLIMQVDHCECVDSNWPVFVKFVINSMPLFSEVLTCLPKSWLFAEGPAGALYGYGDIVEKWTTFINFIPFRKVEHNGISRAQTFLSVGSNQCMNVHDGIVWTRSCWHLQGYFCGTLNFSMKVSSIFNNLCTAVCWNACRTSIY